ncbi:MAG: metalloregulator ArsR/SmtB family transcription factor [Bacteroidota bacterium]
MRAAAGLFRVLGDPTRLRLAVFLAARGETCVCVLAGALAAPPFKVSRHLGIMRSAGLVRARRQGRWMHYRLVSGREGLMECVLKCFRTTLARGAEAAGDLRRAGRMKCNTTSCLTNGRRPPK